MKKSEMLEGTDLYAAYQPLGGGGGGLYASVEEPQQPAPRQQEERKPAQQSSPIINTSQSHQMQPAQTLQAIQNMHNDNIMYDAGSMNRQYEQEQRIINALTELKKQKQNTTITSPSYVDKMMSKKKELAKLLQFALIIALGLSIHFIIKHYLKQFLSENDLSWERELMLRLLYPFAILFILWNLKTFVK